MRASCRRYALVMTSAGPRLLRLLAGTRSPTYIRVVFVVLGVVCLSLALLAVMGDTPDAGPLAAVAAATGVFCFAFVPVLPRLIKWEDRGGELWHRKENGQSERRDGR